MIYSVTKNLGNGDIDIDDNSDISKSFTYDYLVITDHSDTPQYIYAHAAQHGLPVQGSVSETGIRLKSISIQRWDDNNAKAVPSYHLPKKNQGSYAVWKYQVTYSVERSSSQSDNDDDNFHIGGSHAQNFNASIKQYQETSYMCYACQQNVQPSVQPYTSRTAFLINILKEPMAYENVLKNLTISFDFKIKKSEVHAWVSSHIPSLVGSVNAQDITVADLKLVKGRCKLTTLSLSKNNQDNFATVHVQIQITIQKPVAVQVFGNLSESAIPKGGTVPLRVQKWTGNSPLPGTEQKGVVWFYRDQWLGNFSASKYKYGIDYQIYDKKVVLDKNGHFFQTQGDTPPDLRNDDIGKTIAVVAPVKSWKRLDLPKKLK